MNEELKLRALAKRDHRFFVRGYDSKTDEWLFGTEDPRDGVVRLTMDRSNPRRSGIHNALLDILSGRNPGREGVRIKVGPMPRDLGRNGVDENEGRVQIVDLEETELSREARKIVVDGKVVGDWSKELDRAVGRFSDTLVIDRALEEALRLEGNNEIFQGAVWARAREYAAKELGYPLDDPRLSEKEFRRFAPGSLQEALLGAEPDADGKSLRRVRYDPSMELAAQNEEFQSLLDDLGEGRPVDTAQMHQMAINYGVQRALVEHIGGVCAEENTEKKAQDALLADKILLHGHPTRTDDEFRAGSREAGRQLGTQAVGALMELNAVAGGTPLRGSAKDDLRFHAEVMAELETVPGFASLAPNEKLEVYLGAAARRLERYSVREREAVYTEQVKVAVPERKNEMRSPQGGGGRYSRDPTREALFGQRETAIERIEKGALALAGVAGELEKAPTLDL